MSDIRALPVTIGRQVTWFPKSERWRIEVIEPQTMKAVFIKHETLAKIAEADSYDTEVISRLVQVHRAEIEECIGAAEMQDWTDRLGVLPQGIDGIYER